MKQVNERAEPTVQGNWPTQSVDVVISMSTQMIRSTFMILILLTLAGCNRFPSGHSTLTSVPDERPVMIIDPNAGYSIELGRGSGWHGLDTISIDESGKAEIVEQTDDGWRKTAIVLTKSELGQLLASLDRNRILSLDREYHDEKICDGTQWVFVARQGGNFKSVYFNNHFPDEIVKFASDVDEILDIDNQNPEWERVDDSGDHDARFWDAIKK